MRCLAPIFIAGLAGAAQLPPLPPSEPAAGVANPPQTFARTFVFDDDQSGVTNYVIGVNGWMTNSPAKSNRVELIAGTNLLTVAAQRDGETSATAALVYVIAPVQLAVVRPKFGSLGYWQSADAWPQMTFTNLPSALFTFDLRVTNALVEGAAR